MEVPAAVVLNVNIQVDSDKIVIQYSVKNESGAEVFLVNHLTRYQQDKGWIPDSAIVYSKVDQKGNVEISKRIPPVPKDRLVTPRNFYVTPLVAGDRFEEKLVLSVPLHENQPYSPLVPPLPEPREIDGSISFCLGYLEATSSWEAKQVEVHGVSAYTLSRRNFDVVADKPPVEKLLTSKAEKARIYVVAQP